MAARRTARATERATSRRKSASRRAPARSARGTDAATDVLTVLQDDHRRLQALFREFERLEPGSPHLAALVRQACRELEIHAALEEEYFYPAVRAALRESALADVAEVEHGSARDLVARLGRLEPEDPRYHATFAVLAAQLRRHMREEERRLFPPARRAGGDLAHVRDALLTRRHELMDRDDAARP